MVKSISPFDVRDANFRSFSKYDLFDIEYDPELKEIDGYRVEILFLFLMTSNALDIELTALVCSIDNDRYELS